MNANASNTQEDNRSIQRIIFEKAQFGAVPTGFKVTDDDRWHPVAWTQHPDLMTIGFSDGSFVHVMPANHFKDKVSTEPAHRWDEPRKSNVDFSVDAFVAERMQTEPTPGNGFPQVSTLTGSTGFTPETDDALQDLTTATIGDLIRDNPDIDPPKPIAPIGGGLLRGATAPVAADDKAIAERFAPRNTKPEGFA